MGRPTLPRLATWSPDYRLLSGRDSESPPRAPQRESNRKCYAGPFRHGSPRACRGRVLFVWLSARGPHNDAGCLRKTGGEDGDRKLTGSVLQVRSPPRRMAQLISSLGEGWVIAFLARLFSMAKWRRATTGTPKVFKT